MSRKPSPLVIGAFVVGAAVLSVAAVMVFGSGQLFRTTHPFVCYFAGSVNGLQVGAPVKFRGVEIGQVTHINLQLGDNMGEPRIPVYVSLDEDRVTRLSGRPIAMGTAGFLDQWVAAGLRAQLNSESFVTGVLFVNLDLQHESEPVFVRADKEVPEIPTIPTALERVQETVAEVVQEIRQADIQGLVRSIRGTADGLNRLVNSERVDQTIATLQATLERVQSVATVLEGRVGPLAKSAEQATTEAKATLVALRETAGDLRVLLDPQAPIAVELTRALETLGDAARSVRVLADYLERNPNAVVFGKPES